MGLDGAPQIRTVVLRRFAGRALDVHTDARSAKYAELLANPAAALHGWDAAGRIQLRAGGTVTLHVADDVAAASWAALHDGTRATYRVRPGPGAPLPSEGDRAADSSDDEALRVFCVIRLVVDSVDWLHLAPDGHRRACFAWVGGMASATWVVP